MFKWTYCIAPGKPPIPCKEPPTNFDSSVVLWGPPCKHPIIWNSCLVTVDMFHSWYTWTNIHSCEHLDVLHVPWNLVAKVRTQWSVAFPTAFFTYSINFTILQAMNAADVGQRGYKSVPDAAFSTTGLALFGWKCGMGKGTIPLTLDLWWALVQG